MEKETEPVDNLFMICAKLITDSRKTYILIEVDALIFDPILFIITVVILDDAFESKVTSMKDILRIRVRPPRRSLEFRWRAEKLKTPVFR
jgi:Protein of unknown function (DUF3435)